jgi:uncharacterized protein Yka (UPF0111/DUF47 family)
MTWVGKLMPKEELFFPLFEEHAKKLEAAAKTLDHLLDSGSQTELCCDELNQIEKDANTSARRILDGVRTTFVTPFNRVDIKNLITEMDGGIHDMRKAGRAAALLSGDRLAPHMQQIGKFIVDGTGLVTKAMPLLKDIDRHAEEITDICRDISERKEACDDAVEDGLKLIKEKNDPMAFFVQNAIYDRLEAVTDRLQAIGNGIHDIVIDQV